MQQSLQVSSGRKSLLRTQIAYILLVFAFSMGHTLVSAQSGEDLSDRQAVLQKALDLPALQSYYLKNADDSYAPVYVMQHPVAFESGVAVEKFGKPVTFLQRREITASVKSYFLFHQFQVEGNNAVVMADFYFQSGDGELKQVKASIKLSKADGKWTVTASELNKD